MTTSCRVDSFIYTTDAEMAYYVKGGYRSNHLPFYHLREKRSRPPWTLCIIFSSFMLRAMNDVSWWSRFDGSCILWTEVALWTVNGSSLACYPSLPLCPSHLQPTQPFFQFPLRRMNKFSCPKMKENLFQKS